MSTSRMILLVASLTVASALFIDRAKYPRSHPELVAKKLGEIEEAWSKQAETYFINDIANPDSGDPTLADEAHQEFKTQCQDSTSKLMMVGSPDSVSKYFDPVCHQMTGWHAATCQKSKAVIVEQMIAGDVQGNQDYSVASAKNACHDLWWHLINEHKKIAADLVADEAERVRQENKKNRKAEAASAFFQSIEDDKQEAQEKQNRAQEIMNANNKWAARVDKKQYFDHEDSMTDAA